ncbi:hypothetical protein LTR62_007839 [Meristemomyces frigidus]|uniref:Uncharacterized protein n=1 Tax=Meristemomyces frigidus TaxID=1508187 RepID=A0AAN7TAB5_9PEZI|nr:hypothetical protein LTR62_007839 [Meristemomyces frigidus]
MLSQMGKWLFTRLPPLNVDAAPASSTNTAYRIGMHERLLTPADQLVTARTAPHAGDLVPAAGVDSTTVVNYAYWINGEEEDGEDQTEAYFSTMPSGFESNDNLFRRRSTNIVCKPYLLSRIHQAWGREAEHCLMPEVQPDGAAPGWHYKLLKALAKIAFLGTLDEINDLLWQKVMGRQLWRVENVVTVREVYAVLLALKAKGLSTGTLSDD